MLIAHLSDLHLGRKSSVEPLTADRLNTFRRAISRISEQQPDAIVLAGDIFDGPDVESGTVTEAARCLQRTGSIPVIVIPGNHDPAEAVSLWSTFRDALGTATNIRLVLKPEVISLANNRLFVEAYPCTTRYSAEAPWTPRLVLPREIEQAAHVVVAHGTLQGGPVPEGETDAYPFTAEEAEALHADYVALGHFHGVYPPWPGNGEIERTVCYSGTPEPDQFTGDSGYMLLAEVVRNRRTRLSRISVGKRRWISLDLAGPADVARLENLRREIADSEPDRFNIRIRVSPHSYWTPAEIQAVAGVEDSLRALGVPVERRGDMQVQLDAATLDLAELPTGAVREALASLRDELGREADPERRAVLVAALQMGWEKLRAP
jgi:DNA repair exonuclease SbcCD nuclease subunit